MYKNTHSFQMIIFDFQTYFNFLNFQMCFSTPSKICGMKIKTCSFQITQNSCNFSLFVPNFTHKFVFDINGNVSKHRKKNIRSNFGDHQNK